MRQIDYIVIHCSATVKGKNFKAADIDRWHRQRGFNKIGYHYVIDLDGTVEVGRPEDEVGAHVQGHNSRSIGICYIGGLDNDLKPLDTRTPEQKAALKKLVMDLLSRYPNAKVVGHYYFSKKACPCFDVEDWMKKEFGK